MKSYAVSLNIAPDQEDCLALAVQLWGTGSRRSGFHALGSIWIWSCCWHGTILRVNAETMFSPPVLTEDLKVKQATYHDQASTAMAQKTTHCHLFLISISLPTWCPLNPSAGVNWHMFNTLQSCQLVYITIVSIGLWLTGRTVSELVKVVLFI